MRYRMTKHEYGYIREWLYPPLQRSWKGGILVSPCPSVHLSVCPSVDRIVSALYLQQYSSDPFHICTSYKAASEGVSRVMFASKFKHLKFCRILKICNFDFVFFRLGIQYDLMVWIIMRRQGVSSEYRHSSCSGFYDQWHLIAEQRMRNSIFPHKFWRPFLDCMPQLFFKPQHVWFLTHL